MVEVLGLLFNALKEKLSIHSITNKRCEHETRAE